MAEPKLTKSEQALKKNNPKKFAELMKRRQGSSARQMRLSQQKKAEDAGSRETTAAGAIGAMMAVTPVGMAKAFLVPAIVGKSLVKKGAAKVASTAAAKNAGKASKTLVSKLKKVKDPVKGFDPNKPFVMVKGKATNKIPPSKVSKIAKATPDKPMSRVEKIARVAAGQGKPTNVRTGTSARNPGLNLQSKKTGKLSGVRNKDARIGMGVRDMAAPAIRAASVLAASAAAGGKKPKPKSESKSTIADGKRKPQLSKSKPKPKPKAKAVSQAKAAPMMFDAALQSKKQEPKSKAKKKESMSIFDFAAGKGATPRFKQRKSKPGEVTLFGFDVDVDSTDKGMAMEEFDSKYGGQIKSTVKRRMGGKVRGYGKAMRGY